MKREEFTWTLLILASLLPLAACASYHSKPLSSSKTASAFEARTLEDPDLKAFLEKNLQREITPWPPRSWDLTMLTLAASYYHPDLDVARARWGVAEAGVVTAGQRPNPSLTFSPKFNADTVGGLSPWTLGLNLDLPIETAGKRGYRVAQAQALSAAARFKIGVVAWQVRSRLRAALLDLDAASQRETLLQKEVSIQAVSTRLLEERFMAGEVSQPDVTQARIARDRARLALLEASRQKIEARGRVAEAVGLPVSALEGFSIDRLDRPSPAADQLLKEIREEALHHRADLLSALAEYSASQSALQLQIAKQYPDLQIGPGYTWDQGDNQWSLGLSITLPVFHRNQGPIAEAEARRTEAAARFTAIQAQILGEVDRAVVGFQAAIDKLEAADTLLTAQEQQLRSTEAMFQSGEADRLVLVGAQISQTAAALSRLDALIETQQALGRLEDAVQRPLASSGPLPIVPGKNPRKEEDHR